MGVVNGEGDIGYFYVVLIVSKIIEEFLGFEFFVFSCLVFRFLSGFIFNI